MKLITNSVKKTGRYLKSWVVTPKEKVISYVSCLVFFKSPVKYNGRHLFVLDQAIILIGNVPDNHHSFYTVFNNWKADGNDLVYTGDIYDPARYKTLTNVKIDKTEVYIHFKVGNTEHSSEYITANYDHHSWYFTNENNKTFGLIKDQISDVAIVYDLTGEFGNKNKLPLYERSKKITDPRFYKYKHNVYGKNLEHSMFMGLKLDML